MSELDKLNKKAMPLDKRTLSPIEYCIVRTQNVRHELAEAAADQFAKLQSDFIQTRADRENAYKEIREMNTPMPCGHLARYAVNGDEGTQYCALCVLDATQLTIINLVNEDEQ